MQWRSHCHNTLGHVFDWLFLFYARNISFIFNQTFEMHFIIKLISLAGT